MNELDLLKTHWKKEDNYIKFKKDDILKMIHKSSSSIVKWIFIICCLEFILGLILSFSIPSEEEKFKAMDYIFIIYDVIFYGVILYFIYNFFSLYKNIKSSHDTKLLLESIVAVRTNADRYIQFNLIFINIAFFLVFLSTLFEKHQESYSWGRVIFVLVIFGIVIALFALLFRAILKLYYKLLYGILLKKLNKNYEELQRLEEE